MRSSIIWALATVVLLPLDITSAQDTRNVDPRLSDPAFVKLRDDALAAGRCTDRTNPAGLSTPRARYPSALSRDRISGTAVTESIVLPNGSLAFTRIMRASHPEFGKAALEVLKQYRYKPGTCGGQPVPRMITVAHTFSVQ
jgi:TonB family protein